ncbi:Hypothetical protein XNRR2_5789 [Streptomyces albidoflavus]|nr:Hypothetical protein XNR_5789 [Streptomyces albidoflavus]SCE39072.1 hypothetical protein GA0115236_15265 [Streptomyces sp. IgraMP-1]EFE79723.1 predicted protein [Streptomyces albidoflavus]QLP95947.1 Hypothetical protein XNRR2_5789 [Streptomyces albidoflavus]WAE14260.1 Hypothetical protein SAD14_5789 [Streptomyces albidoflavus]
MPLHLAEPALHLCVNLITWREDIAEEISALG